MWKTWPAPVIPSPAQPAATAVSSVNTIDELQDELAERVASKTKAAKDFQIIVTVFQDPIGTLMEPGRSVADNDTACRPKADPERRSAPNLFPAYQTNLAVAGAFGLDAPLAALGRAGVTTKTDDSVVLTVDQASGQILTGAALRDVLGDPNCRQARGDRTMWLVRGYIGGQRSFTVSRDQSVDLNASTKLASFNVTPVGSNKMSVQDKAPQLFLQVISEVPASSSSGTGSSNPNVGPLSPSTPRLAPPSVPAGQAPTTATKGRIYLQQDENDHSPRGAQVIAALHAYNVVRKIERIPSAKMPGAAQVRYFNEDDRARAQEVAGLLKGIGLDARVVRIGLPSPPGQLEVWFPRVATPAAA
jgi:hypothetical protein